MSPNGRSFAYRRTLQFKRLFLSSLARTAGEKFAPFDGYDVFAYFRSGQSGRVLSSPLIAPLLYRDGVLGSQGVPGFPLFVHNYVHGEVTWIADVETLVSTYCACDAEVLLHRHSRGGSFG
jgi:hypothetical protein